MNVQTDWKSRCSYTAGRNISRAAAASSFVENRDGSAANILVKQQLAHDDVVFDNSNI